MDPITILNMVQQALDLVQRIRRTVKDVQGTLKEEDQAKIDQALRQLQEEGDGLYDVVTAALREAANR